MTTIDDILFPPIEPYESGYVNVDNIHSLYWEQCGNPDGVPVVYLHGGPGSGCDEKSRCFFDPEYYRVILFDQRGAKKSKPLGETENNSPEHLVSDIEVLRNMFGVEKWHVFGGSWGSALGLLYAQTHPDRCLGLILRSITFFEKEELDWWFQGMGNFFPELWEDFAAITQEEKQDNLVSVYYDMFMSDNEEIRIKAGKAMQTYGRGCGSLLPSPINSDWNDPDYAAHTIAFYKMFVYYCVHHRFESGKLLDGVAGMRDIPGIIVQGRYDVICPPVMAHKLHRAWPEAEYVIVPDASHSSRETSLAAALVQATEKFKKVSENHAVMNYCILAQHQDAERRSL